MAQHNSGNNGNIVWHGWFGSLRQESNIHTHKHTRTHFTLCMTPYSGPDLGNSNRFAAAFVSIGHSRSLAVRVYAGASVYTCVFALSTRACAYVWDSKFSAVSLNAAAGAGANAMHTHTNLTHLHTHTNSQNRILCRESRTCYLMRARAHALQASQSNLL